MEGFAGYYGQTNLHPLALAVVVLLGICVFVVPRRHALVPLFIAATTAPMAQRLVFGGADFTLLRLLLLVYVLRVLMRGERHGFVWNRLDTAVVLWTISGTLIMTLHFGSVDSFINRVGWSYDILLTYFVARCLIREWEDLLSLARAIAVVGVPVAILFLIEWSTRYNLFSVFGGVNEVTSIRQGRLRCQGPFAHPILAGTFWAATLPMIWMLWRGQGSDRFLAVVGSASAAMVVVASASSTPIMTAAIACLGLALYSFRDQRTLMWLGLIGVLALLHFVLMNNPVWHLMARMDMLGGSTGWHRYWIFETFLRNFSEWAATGHADPVEWGVWQMRDITNQYILEGLRGGLLTLMIFITALVLAFANVGRSLTAIVAEGSAPQRQWWVWLVGVAIFVHAVTFFGVSYFGQMITIFYVQLAIAGSLGTLVRAPAVEREATVLERDQITESGAAPLNERGVLGRFLPPNGAATLPGEYR